MCVGVEDTEDAEDAEDVEGVKGVGGVAGAEGAGCVGCSGGERQEETPGYQAARTSIVQSRGPMAELPAASMGGFAAVLMVMVAGFAEAPGTVAGGPMAVANRLGDWAREAPRPNNNNSQCAGTAKPITASACYAEETITSPAGAAMLHILQTTHLAHSSTCLSVYFILLFGGERRDQR